MGGGVDSSQDDSTPNGVGRGSRVVSGKLDPQRGRGTQGRRNPGIPHSVPIPTGGGRTGAGGKGRKPTHRLINQGSRARWRRRRGAKRQDGGDRQGDRDGGAGHPPEHFNGADGTRSEHGTLARRKYNLLALEATERGPASAGTAGGEDGHGATDHIAGRIWEEEGDGNPKRARSDQEPDKGEPHPQTFARA